MADIIIIDKEQEKTEENERERERNWKRTKKMRAIEWVREKDQKCLATER